MSAIKIQIGLSETHRYKAAELYYSAFRQKLHPIFRNEQAGLQVIERSLNNAYAIAALHDGDLVGIAGFHDTNSNLLDIKPKHMTDAFGFIGGWGRLFALMIFDRKVEAGVLLMDGIVVDPAMRGQGIGTKLLDAIVDYARTKKYEQVRLDVVDTNPRARQLYERQEFVPIKTSSSPYFKQIFGFSGATTMQKAV